ncbi:MAG: GH3 auxin-responsive promoter family protein [Bacteroidetes bacterium]|nr:GH3 auxin-responsive promoter family protein [Bacteroidota bacterium]
MGLKSLLARPFASVVAKRVKKVSLNATAAQDKVFKQLIASAANTAFGRDHHFDKIKTYEDFKKQVPIRDYEQLKPYIERVTKGEKDVLWPGKPIYFCKTSGTTSGTKYIPITSDSIGNHINSARDALLLYIHATGNSDFLNGKLIFLSGSPELQEISGIPLGRLSGIVNHHVPGYLRRDQMPSYKTNCIEDWEKKVEKIATETLKENMTLISGIPSWVQMYFEVLQEKTGFKTIKEIFPNFSVFVYGGVNFEPYRSRFEKLIGNKIDSIETFPASEGFIAYQDAHPSEGLLLIVDSGIFYEFIPLEDFHSENPRRVSLADVEIGINYVLIMNTNAGLWGYNIGDTVKFVSKNPYRLIVSGRVKHFISAFGEHVIAEEVELALKEASLGETIEVAEFTVAPQVSPENGLPYHEWFIEFKNKPSDPEKFRLKMDQALQKKNIYYRDLITGKVLQPLVIRAVENDSFIHYMKSQGKLGGQNKVPRLSNDRKIADELIKNTRETWGLDN